MVIRPIFIYYGIYFSFKIDKVSVSGKMKFCTCASPIDKLRHYCVLYRFIAGKHEIVIGKPILFPTDIEEDPNNLNKEVLLLRVKVSDTFDVDVEPKPIDRLQISIRCGDDTFDYLHNGLRYTKNRKWVEKQNDALEWPWRHEEDIYGKNLSPLQPNP
jgi:hypothetical protein